MKRVAKNAGMTGFIIAAALIFVMKAIMTNMMMTPLTHPYPELNTGFALSVGERALNAGARNAVRIFQGLRLREVMSKKMSNERLKGGLKSMQVKSIDEYKIKERLKESILPICKEALALIEAHERVREVENHTRKQAIKKIKEQDLRITELEGLLDSVITETSRTITPELREKIDTALNKNKTE